jgi:hypothetical protein
MIMLQYMYHAAILPDNIYSIGTEHLQIYVKYP